MPTYEYYCPENHRTLEVMHGMNDRLSTWGQACEAAEVDPGQTSPDTPVEKLLGAGMVLSSSRTADGPIDCSGPPAGGGCCGGMCGPR